MGGLEGPFIGGSVELEDGFVSFLKLEVVLLLESFFDFSDLSSTS